MNQNCYECVYKHLAAALSYAKEVMGGFDSKSELNHEIDFLGEIINAEHHLELIDQALFSALRDFRKSCVSRRIKLTEADTDIIREIYNDVLKHEENGPGKALKMPAVAQAKAYSQIYSQEKFTVVYDSITDKEYFDLSLKLLRDNAENQIDVIVLKSNVDLSEYDYITLAETDSLYSLIESGKIAEDNFVYMKENHFIIKHFDFNFLFNSYAQQIAPNHKELRAKGIKEYPYTWDVGKPQTINKTKFLEVMKDQPTDNLLTTYFNLINEPEEYNSRFNILTLEKTLCCSNKARISKMTFVEVTNKTALPSLKEWLDKYMNK